MISEGVASYIFVERSEGVFERRKVNPVVQGRQYSFLDQGLRQGERVVTSGALLLNSELSESN